MIPDLAAIQKAHGVIQPYIHRTPVMSSSNINELLGMEIYFKCENFQRCGAFKMRGATNAVNNLSDDELKMGVATHSSGNHAQALACAAKTKSIDAYIVMPENAPSVKVAGVKHYGAEIIFCKPTIEERELTLNRVVKETGATFIHPFNNYRVIEGQATAALELLEDVQNLDFLLVPVGGGGLLSGTALSTHFKSPDTRVIGCEPAGADDAFSSFQAGYIIPSIDPNTIADGLLTSLSEKTFEIIQKYVHDILIVEDPDIVKAMKLIWERMKIVIEPSAAVPLAVVMAHHEDFRNKKLGIILSGGNVDLSKLPF
jgi:threonine dehydratase